MPAHQEVVHHHDPRDRPEQAGVAEQPVGVDAFQAEVGNDPAELLQQLVGHQRQADETGEPDGAGAADEFRCDVLEVVGRRDDVRRGVGREGGDDDQRHRHRHPAGAGDVPDQADRVGNRLAHQRSRGGGHHHAEGGEQEHGQRQAEDLSEYLVLLAARIAAEVGDVQRQRGPEADHRRQPGHEVAGDAGAFRPLRRLRQQFTDRYVRQRPHQQAEADQHQQRCRECLQPFDRLRAAQHHPQVQPPEQEETDHLAGAAEGLPGGKDRTEEEMDRQPAEQRLDAEPAARDHGADQAWHVGADDAERSAQQHREGNAVAGAGEGIEGQRDQHHQVGQQDRQQRFADAEAEVGGEDAAEGVGGHADGHADPQRGDVPPVPGTLFHPGRGDVVVVAGTVEYVAAGGQLDQAVALGHFRSALLHGPLQNSFSYSLIGLMRWPEYRTTSTAPPVRTMPWRAALNKRAENPATSLGRPVYWR